MNATTKPQPSKFNIARILRNAHEATRKIRRHYPDANYHVTFAIALKQEWARVKSVRAQAEASGFSAADLEAARARRAAARAMQDAEDRARQASFR
jgi:hypothetical protein